MTNADYVFQALSYVDDELILAADRALNPVRRTASTHRATKKLWRIALIAALIAALLTVTAAATGWFGLETRYIAPAQPTDFTTADSAVQHFDFAVFTGSDWAYICPSGTADSPEYKAQSEWIRWRAQYLAEKDTDEEWKREYFATPSPAWIDEYDDGTWGGTSGIYAAYAPSMMDKLRALASDNGIALHTVRSFVNTPEELTALTGNAAPIPAGDNMSYAYVYEDGSFAINAYIGAIESAGTDSFYYIYKGCRGTVPEFSYQVEAERYALREDWSYTTPRGEQLYLSLVPDLPPEGTVPSTYKAYSQLFILYTTDTYFMNISAQMEEPVTHEQAENFAARFIYE